MRVEHRFHFRRVDVEPIHDDHVLLALDDRRVVVLVHPRDIARVEPDAAVGSVSEHVGAVFGLVPVAFHHLRPRDAQLARLPDRQLVPAALDVHDLHVRVGEWQSDGAHPSRGELRRGVRDRRGLRQPVPFVQRAADAALEFFHDLDRADVTLSTMPQPARARARPLRDGSERHDKRLARQGSTSGESREIDASTCSGSYLGWMTCSAPSRRPTIMQTVKA